MQHGPIIGRKLTQPRDCPKFDAGTSCTKFERNLNTAEVQHVPLSGSQTSSAEAAAVAEAEGEACMSATPKSPVPRLPETQAEVGDDRKDEDDGASGWVKEPEADAVEVADADEAGRPCCCCC